MFGATGAMLSVATRLQAFKLKLCHQSNELLDGRYFATALGSLRRSSFFYWQGRH
jgi:hypothetical protein